MKKLWWLTKCHFPVAGIGLFFLLTASWLNPAAAQKIRVENIRYELNDDYIEIYYDLIGDPSKEYKVSVALKREQDPRFIFNPSSIRGDVGKGRFAGESRKIIWNFTNEFKPDPEVTDYFFEVTASKGSKTWIYLVGGGVLVAGGATAAILLLGNKDKSTTGKTFPVPARP